MEQQVTFEQVSAVCGRISAEGARATARAIHAETGGSMTTVLRYKRQWEEERQRAELANAPLSPALQSAIMAEIARAVEAARRDVDEAMIAAACREKEAIEALEAAEIRNGELSANLEEVRAETTKALRRADKDAAAAAQQIQGLEGQVRGLLEERDRLLRSGEAARAEEAKALLQLERADKAVVTAEERARALEEQLAAYQNTNTELEKQLAVALAQREALEAAGKAASAEGRERLQELKKELAQTKARLGEERKARGAAERRVAVLEAANVKAAKG